MPRTIEELRESFVWGDIRTIHEVGRVAVVEYLHHPNRKGTDNRIAFHPYIHGLRNKDVFSDTSHTFDTLEEAVIYALIYQRMDDPNAATYLAAFVMRGTG